MPFPPTTLRNLVPILLAAAMGSGLHAEADAKLRVATHTGGLAFALTGTTGTGPWILQHSPDGRSWEDVTFWETAEAGSEPPEFVIQRAALRTPDAREGLFRAIQLAEDDPFRRRFLSERTKWRLAGISSYQYEFSQNSGQISWHGIVNVADDEVASFTTLDQWPPGFEPDVPTVDDLFERIASAIAANAVTINVTWHPVHGAPVTCYIDISEFLADEERGWSILSLTPAP